MSKQNNTIQSKTDKLSELLTWFNGDGFLIEEAIEKFKEAEKLASEIETDLRSLKNEINVIKQKFDTES